MQEKKENPIIERIMVEKEDGNLYYLGKNGNLY